MPFDDIHVHQVMLADELRTRGYKTAINEIVQPGSTVLDFGCGTGILSFFAARAGAKIVYAVDKSRFIRVAKALSEKNGFSNIVFFHGDGDELNLPEEVDVIVSECMGNFAVDEWSLGSLFSLREKYLRTGGKVIPGRISIRAAMIGDKEIHNELSYFKTKPYGIDFSTIEDWPYYRCEGRRLTPSQVLSPASNMGDIDLHTCREVPGSYSGTCELEKESDVYGICAWFVARLTDNIVLDTGPLALKTHWNQMIFPLVEPLHVAANTQLKLTISLERDKKGKQTLWRWFVDDGSQVIKMDNFVSAAWVMRDLPIGELT
jgi:protein arginine N-methyltransferase 1